MPSVQPRVEAPSIDDLCTEGFRAVAGRAPTGEELTRAVRHHFEEVLDAIWQVATREDVTRFKILENTATVVLTKGRRRYDLPTDFDRPIATCLLKGTLSGTVAPAADATDTGVDGAVPADGTTYLPAEDAEDFEDYEFENPPSYVLSGLPLVITSGDAVGSIREIVSATTYLVPAPVHLFTLDSAWEDPEIPAEGDTFMVVENRPEWITEEMREYGDEFSARAGLGKPCSFNDYDNSLILDVAPDDDVYALLLRYWANPLKLDKESRAMERLVANWRTAIVRGIEWRTAAVIDDSRAAAKEKAFEAAALSVVLKEIDRGPRFEGFVPWGRL